MTFILRFAVPSYTWSAKPPAELKEGMNIVHYLLGNAWNTRFSVMFDLRMVSKNWNTLHQSSRPLLDANEHISYVNSQ